MIDLARNAIKEKEQNEALYHFLKNQIVALDQGILDLKYTPIRFSIQLSHYLGFALDNNYSQEDIYFDLMHGRFIDNDIRHNNILDEECSYLLSQIMNDEKSIQISKDFRNQILDHLIEYYRLHVEGFQGLKSIGVIRQILS